MGDKNGKDEIRIQRRPFKQGERARHLELLAKNQIALRVATAQVKKCKEAIETCLDDIQANGYVAEAQGRLAVDDEDEAAEARA